MLLLGLALYSSGQDAHSAQDIQGKIIRTYPNPATSYITFDVQNNYQKGLTIVVYSFLGKKMYEAQNVSEKTTLTLSDFNRGVYVYRLTDPTGKVVDSGKFQVSR